MEAGRPHVQTRLREYAIELLKDLPIPEDHEELMGKGGVYWEERLIDD